MVIIYSAVYSIITNLNNDSILAKMLTEFVIKFLVLKACLFNLSETGGSHEAYYIDYTYMMLLYHFDLCPLSAYNYRSPNLDCGFVNKV